MGKDERIFSRQPIPSRRGDEWLFTEIDTERWDVSVFTQLWRRAHRDDPRSRPGDQKSFVPIAGSEVLGDDMPDVSPLIESLEEIFSQWESALSASEEIGQKAWQDFKELNFTDLVQALAAGEVARANDALRDILYALMSTTSDLVTRLHRKDETVSGMDVAVTRLQKTLDASGGITDELYMEWAIAADSLVATVEELSRIESELSQFYKRISDAYQEAFELASRDNPQLAVALGVLEGDLSQDSFLVTAFEYQQDPGKFDLRPIRDAAQTAQESVKACRQIEKQVSQVWAEFKDSSTMLLAKRTQVSRHIQALELASRNMLEYGRRLGPDVARPFELKAGQAITRERFERAEQLLRDRQWAPHTYRNRLDGLVNNSLSMAGQQPQFPGEVRQVIDDAVAAIARIVTPEPTTVGSKKDASVAAASSVATVIKSPRVATVTISDARAQELYEMVQGVAGILTCKSNYFAQSNLKAMLDIIQRTGHCTTTEVGQYLPRVRDLSKRSGERETVRESKYVTDRWKNSGCTWIVFMGRGRWRLKLALKVKKKAEAARAKHGLTEPAIREAQEARKLEFDEKRRTYKEGKK